MKRIVLLLLAAVSVLSASAQYRDVKLPEKPKQEGHRNYLAENKGFWFTVDLEGGSSIMSATPNMQYVAATAAAGYRFSQYLRVGIGLGAKYYVHNAYVRNTDNKVGVPLFANVRGNFISAYDRDGVPFWSVNIGGLTHEGFFASPTIGYSFGGMRNNFLIGISYTIQSFKDFTQARRTYSYFGLKLAYEL